MADAADETFESADAGAAEVIPMEAGQIRKGGYMVIKVPLCPGSTERVRVSRVTSYLSGLK